MALILVVDDEPETLGSIRRVVADAGFTVLTAGSGEQALQLIAEKVPDLVILDVIMPEMTGIEVCKRIRANPYYARLPILFLTARSRPSDIAEGLDAGGDDYVTKPFQVVELPARIRALLRRVPGAALDSGSQYLTVGTLRLSMTRPVIEMGEQAVELTHMEYAMLHYLLQRPGRPCSVEDLLEEVWQYPPGTGDSSLVYAHVKNLRKKIEPKPDEPVYVLNVRGQGYMITDPSYGLS
jgi:DNA-binding response OmpR family regulator